MISIFTVANTVTRVDTNGCDDTSSLLTQYALELLTAILSQLSSDTQTQGKFRNNLIPRLLRDTMVLNLHAQLQLGSAYVPGE